MSKSTAASPKLYNNEAVDDDDAVIVVAFSGCWIHGNGPILQICFNVDSS